MASYKRWGPKKPTGGRGYFPDSPGIGEKSLRTYHAMLERAIERATEQESSTLIPGLRAALALFQGYFGVFESEKGGD